jgi:hypothetical protein
MVGGSASSSTPQLPDGGRRPVVATKPLLIPALIVVLARLASAARSSKRVKAAKAHSKLSPDAPAESSQDQGQPMPHKFTIGQAVDLAPTILRQAATGEYEIRHLLPAPDGDPDNPCYRIKSIGENHERVVRESEISLSKKSESIFSP